MSLLLLFIAFVLSYYAVNQYERTRKSSWGWAVVTGGIVAVIILLGPVKTF